MVNKKDLIVSAAIDSIAENGLLDFTIKDVAERCDCAEALVYKYYYNRDGLLTAARRHLSETANRMIEEEVYPVLETDEPPAVKIKKAFIGFLKAIVKAKNLTIFYNILLESKYREETLSNYRDFVYRMSSDVASKIGFPDDFNRLIKRVPLIYLETQIIDGSNSFAKKIILGELPNNQETYEHVFDILCMGIPSLLKD